MVVAAAIESATRAAKVEQAGNGNGKRQAAEVKLGPRRDVAEFEKRKGMENSNLHHVEGEEIDIPYTKS